MLGGSAKKTLGLSIESVCEWTEWWGLHHGSGEGVGGVCWHWSSFPSNSETSYHSVHISTDVRSMRSEVFSKCSFHFDEQCWFSAGGMFYMCSLPLTKPTERSTNCGMCFHRNVRVLIWWKCLNVVVCYSDLLLNRFLTAEHTPTIPVQPITFISLWSAFPRVLHQVVSVFQWIQFKVSGCNQQHWACSVTKIKTGFQMFTLLP